MAGVGQKIDFTANLPDELLWKVFGYLPLRGKLRLESVSHRFQRIVLDLLKRPQPLKLSTYPPSELNGYKIPSDHLSEALLALASKSKFSRIDIWFGWKKRNTEQTEQMDSLLSTLLVTNCLDKVVSFECNYGPSQDVLEKIFTQCVKLSSVDLNFDVFPPNIQLRERLADVTFALDVNTLLNMKVLTKLDLKLTGYSQDQLVELFHSLKPHTLQKLSLTFYEEVAPLDLTEIAKQLGGTNAWSVLQELEIGWEDTTTAHIDLTKFIESLTLIPSLNKCEIFFDAVFHIVPENQFVAAMTSLFKSDIKITVSSPWEPCILRPEIPFEIPDCQAVANIRELQNVFPNIIIDFSVNDGTIFLTLSVGNGRFEESVYPFHCAVSGCLECNRFYPRVLTALQRKANGHTDAHLEVYQLDRCRMSTIVENLNEKNNSSFPWLAVSSEVNEDLVTIHFEVPNEGGDGEIETHQFNVTVGCGHCFNNYSCIRCVNVE